MTKHSPITPRASLLERAAEVYDFAEAMRARAPQPREETRTPPAEAGEAPEAAKLHLPVIRKAPRTGTEPIDRDYLRDGGFILPDAPVGALAEEFRIVKRQILLPAMAGEAKGRMILVCSAQPNEGKTFCSVNLALSMASEKDVEILLVDADFAKPEILSTLGLQGGPGIMDAIADPAIDVESCVIRTDLPNLSVLPAGRQMSDVTELLASERTRIVLDQLGRDPARIVIFDSSPALAASSASVLALHVGQVVMVVRADRTREEELRDAIGLLGGCDDIKLLLNAVSFAPGSRRFGAYYGYGG